MARIIIGTAGHVDHGKTRLTRALTGVDTDRLPAEKSRGITIELGFAPWRLTDEITADIIDVPGHEKFVRTMAAGVAAIDLALLLVAADEGIMPQTAEHFHILRLLGVRRCIFVISKADKATSEQIAELTAKLRQWAADTPFAAAPIISVSAENGAGLDQLTAEVKRQAAAIISDRRNLKLNNASNILNDNYQENIANHKNARIPVDRVFSVKGFGTVVTGTLWGGSIAAGDIVEVQPLGKRVKIRRLEVNGEAVEQCGGSCRIALNLPDLEKSEIPRGSWVALPELLTAAHTIGAELTLLAGSPRLKNNARVHIRFGAREVNGRIRFDGDYLPPGAENAQVKIFPEESIFPLVGDKMIIASYSPVSTIGGARVTAINPPKRKKSAQNFEQKLVEFLQKYHADHPSAFGITQAKLWDSLFPKGNGPEDFAERLEKMLGEGKLQKQGAYWALPDFKPQADKRTQKQMDRVLRALAENGFAPPAVESLLRYTSPAKAREIVERLTAEGKIIKSGEVIFAAAALKEAEKIILSYLRRRGSVSLSEARDLFGTSRKFALPILNYLDSQELTRRQGDVRVLKNK